MTDMIFYSKNCLNEPHCSLKDVLEKFDKCKGQLQRAEKQLAEDEEIQVDMRLKIDELKGLLSHKEQECETLGKINKNLLNENQDLRRTLNEISQNIIAKEQECEELKKQLTILDDEGVVVEITAKQFEEYKKLKQIFADDENKVLQQIFQKLANMR